MPRQADGGLAACAAIDVVCMATAGLLTASGPKLPANAGNKGLLGTKRCWSTRLARHNHREQDSAERSPYFEAMLA